MGKKKIVFKDLFAGFADRFLEFILVFAVLVAFIGFIHLLANETLVGEETIVGVEASPPAQTEQRETNMLYIKHKNAVLRARLVLAEKKLREAQKQAEFLEKMLTEPSQPKYSVTPEERELMAQIVYLEANAESAEGQQAVAEVILNRRDNGRFPDTIREVVFAPGQFTSANYLEWAKTNADNYAAVDAALMGDAPILEPDVVFFSQQGENDRVYAKIGNHVFCREYIW